MHTTSRDLMSSYGGNCDFDRLLATPKTIAICWAVAALLVLASGLPVAVETTHVLARGIAPQAERLAHAAAHPTLSTAAPARHATSS
jgi:hypothetical protein